MIDAVFPGSFDPPTYGHLDIIARSAKIFNSLAVVIAQNSAKDYLFSAEERKEMMLELTASYHNVTTHIWDRLIIDFAAQSSASVIVRGVRALGDFSHEFELSMVNKELDKNIETIFMPTGSRYVVMRSSVIKEIARLGGDISGMSPKTVADRLARRVAELA